MKDEDILFNYTFDHGALGCMLTVVDVADPLNPEIKGSVYYGGEGRNVDYFHKGGALGRKYACVASGFGSLYIIDVTNL